MKTLKKNSVLIIFLCFTLTINAQKLELNIKKSNVSWTGKAAFNAYALTGSLQVKAGKLTIENDSVKALEVSIDMKSLHHKNKDLKKHLRGKDFFEVKKYPTAMFTLTKPVSIKDGKAMLNGTMNIKTTNREEKIPVAIFIQNKEVKISFSTQLDRTKYGVKFNSPSFFKKMKENAIADKFILKGKLFFE